MKKKLLIFHILYYILFLLIYVGAAYAAVRLLKTDNLAAAVVRAGVLLFVMTPAMILVFARFSLLRWYVDPLAAAIVPLFLYCVMVINQHKHTGAFGKAFAEVNEALANDSGMGWAFLIGLFLFGLLASFSPARKNGKSISYKLVVKICAK